MNFKDAKLKKKIEKICSGNNFRCIKQSYFSTSESFIKSLKDEKVYTLITKKLWKKICQKENLENKGISFWIKESDKSKIFISFNENDQIELKLIKNNNGDIIFDKNSLPLTEENNHENHLSKEENKIKENDKVHQDNKIDEFDRLLYYFQNGLNILLSIISFQIELKGKMEKLKSDEEKVEKCYLISKKWLNEYKNFYFNDKLLEMLEKNFKINDLIDLKHEEKKIIFNNMFSYNNNKYDFNSKIKENGNKAFKFSEEAINEIFPKINSQLDFNDIEIINEDTLNKLIVNDINKEKKRNNINRNKINGYEYIMKEKQISYKTK